MKVALPSEDSLEFVLEQHLPDLLGYCYRVLGLTHDAQLGDGTTFVHVATVAEGVEDVLPGLAAFAEFQRDIAGRCAVQPAVRKARVIGRYIPRVR